jgi:hypothetical protein
MEYVEGRTLGSVLDEDVRRCGAMPADQALYIGSVKACFQAAGWQMKINKVDDSTWGDGTVLDQFPSAGTDVDPQDVPEIELRVSTGYPVQ